MFFGFGGYGFVEGDVEDVFVWVSECVLDQCGSFVGVGEGVYSYEFVVVVDDSLLFGGVLGGVVVGYEVFFGGGLEKVENVLILWGC